MSFLFLCIRRMIKEIETAIPEIRLKIVKIAQGKQTLSCFYSVRGGRQLLK